MVASNLKCAIGLLVSIEVFQKVSLSYGVSHAALWRAMVEPDPTGLRALCGSERESAPLWRGIVHYMACFCSVHNLFYAGSSLL